MSDPLLVDLYANDLNGRPDIQALVNAGPPWHGLVMKATEGVYYPSRPTTKDWFLSHWGQAKDLAKDRYGVDWFRGAYHYLRVDEDAKQQANLYLALIAQAGGWGSGDLQPIVDVENAENPPNASAQQIIDATSKFSEVVLAATGKNPILYGGAYIRDKKIKDHMGCEYVWVADYEGTLTPHVYTDMGWDLSKVFGWQYCGDGIAKLLNYPRTAPVGGNGKVDITAVVLAGGGQAALQAIRDGLSVCTPLQP